MPDVDHGTTNVTVDVNDFGTTYHGTAATVGDDVSWRVGDSSVCGFNYNNKSAEVGFTGLKEGETDVKLTWTDKHGKTHVQRFKVKVTDKRSESSRRK